MLCEEFFRDDPDGAQDDQELGIERADRGETHRRRPCG